MNKWTAAAHLEHVDPDIRNNMGGAIYWGRDGNQPPSNILSLLVKIRWKIYQLEQKRIWRKERAVN